MNRRLLVKILPAILFFLIILFVISVYFEWQISGNEQSGSTAVVTTAAPMEIISTSGALIISDYDWKINGVSVKSDNNAKFGDSVYAHVTLTSSKHDYENYVYFMIIIDDGKCFSDDFYAKLTENNYIQCDRTILYSDSPDAASSGDSRRIGVNTKINEGESKEFVYHFQVDPFINDYGTYYMLISYINQDNVMEYIEIDQKHGIKI